MTKELNFYQALDLMRSGKIVTTNSGKLYLRIADGTLEVSYALEGWKKSYVSFTWLNMQSYVKYEEPGHDWAWAVEQLKSGHKVKRKIWVETYISRLYGEFRWKSGGLVTLSRALENTLTESTDWVLAE